MSAGRLDRRIVVVSVRVVIAVIVWASALAAPGAAPPSIPPHPSLVTPSG